MAFRSGEELLEGKELAAIDERVTREQPHLGEAVKNNAVGFAVSTAARIARVVSPSSISDGWKTEASVSPARLAAEPVRSQTSSAPAPSRANCRCSPGPQATP